MGCLHGRGTVPRAYFTADTAVVWSVYPVHATRWNGAFSFRSRKVVREASREATPAAAAAVVAPEVETELSSTPETLSTHDGDAAS
jgi:hypothetical protein